MQETANKREIFWPCCRNDSWHAWTARPSVGLSYYFSAVQHTIITQAFNAHQLCRW